MPSGPTCTPTCINSLSCSTGCCIFAGGDQSSQPTGYCAPKASCCGTTGSNCKDGQICASLSSGVSKCADTCTASAECSITLCCAALKGDAGACLNLSDIKTPCLP
jgi:hypothetical protein